MKKHQIICITVLFFNNAFCQNLVIKGKVKCTTQSVNSTKGAENIVIVPSFMPSKSTITLSQPSGYFEFNTGIPISKIQDKTVSVYVVTRCKTCSEAPKRIFVSEDQDRQNRNDNKRYVTIKEWQMNVICNKAELKPYAADSVLRILMKQPDQNLEKVSNITALTGAPMFLNFLTNLITVVGATGFPQDSFFVNKINLGKINYGKILLGSPFSNSANIGFNFSPSRDISEAEFWNPSAIAFSRKPQNISLLTNVRNLAKISGFYRINKNISIAVGGIFTLQNEFRNIEYTQNSNIRIEDSTKMTLKEYAGYLSPIIKVTNNFSLGFTIKSIWQNFNIPHVVFVLPKNGGVGIFYNNNITKQNFDFDLSATYKVNNALQIGINAMNLAGSTLYSDAFIPNAKNIPIQKQRSIGLGLTYKLQKLNVGTDILLTESGLYDASIGVNYVPFNNALLSAGFALKQKSYSAAFRIKHFRIAYINDNHFLTNEIRKAKFSLFNGQIYGGFIFDLD